MKSFINVSALVIFVTILDVGLAQSTGLGQKCQSDKECQDKNSLCRNQTCACIERYSFKEDNGKCEPNECFRDHECSSKYPNTHCVKGFCKCTTGFVESNQHKNFCLGVAHHAEECEEVNQCVDKDATCVKGKCRCKRNHKWDGTACSTAHLVNSSKFLFAFVSVFWILKK